MGGKCVVHVSVILISGILESALDLLPQLVKIIHRNIPRLGFDPVIFVFFDLLFLFAKLLQALRIKIMSVSFFILPAVIVGTIAPLSFTLPQNGTGFIFSSGLCHNDDSSLLFLVWALSQ